MMREKHEMGAQQILNETGHNGRLISGNVENYIKVNLVFFATV